MYAVVDVETTGGKYGEEGITEIAVYQYDGHELTDQFISLINPERPIQPFVENLTGINQRMLRNAPKFYELAKRIVEITTDCVLVATMPLLITACCKPNLTGWDLILNEKHSVQLNSLKNSSLM